MLVKSDRLIQFVQSVGEYSILLLTINIDIKKSKHKKREKAGE